MSKTRNKRSDPATIKQGTLDLKHMEQLSKFNTLTNSLSSKKTQLKNFENELAELLKTNPIKFSSDDIRRKSFLLDSIEKLKSEIESIETGKEPLNYIGDVMSILVDYYDNNGESAENDVNEEFMNELHSGGKKNILTYYLCESHLSKNRNKGSPNDMFESILPKKDNSDKSKTANKTKPSRAKLYDQYLDITNSSYTIPKSHAEVCSNPLCGKEDVIVVTDGCIVCSACGATEHNFITSEKPNYKEPTQDSGTYAYKRINHLTEILSQLQAKETTDIPQIVFSNVLRELKKRKINKNELDIFRLRKILKKLGYRNCYEHISYILQTINGKEPPNFSRADEAKIKKMFKDIQKPFAIYCPKQRKNFLNYSYVLHKFCELLELDQYLDYFPLLKNNSKLLQHDRVWKNICGYMRWKFYKSL